MEQKRRIVILGGGFAGAFTARHLHKLAPPDVEVELISDRNYFVFQPLLAEVAAGTINAQDAVTPLRLLLKGITVRMGDVRTIDFENRTVQLAQGSRRIPAYRSYDHLVIALGQRTVLDRFEGFAEHSFCLRDLAHAHELRNHVIQCLEHADVTENTALKARLLTFVIAGAGFSGVEIAGELHEMLQRTLKHYPRIHRDEINTILVQRGERILPELSPTLGEYAAEKMQKYGIKVRYGQSLARATGTTVYTQDGGIIPTHTLITTIGNGATELVESLDLPMLGGRIQTEPDMQVVGYTNVWALGDAAHIPISHEESAPTTAQFAVREARCLAENLVAALDGRPTRPFSYTPKGTMASIGHYRAVAEVYGRKLSGLSAWLLWRSFYIGMLPGFSTRLRVALNWLFDYFLPRSIVQVKTRTNSGVRVVHFAKDDVLFAPDQIVDGFYMVVHGTLESRVPMTGGEDFVRILGPGDHWGERCLTEGTPTLGKLTAVEDSKVLVLESTDFSRLRQALPPFADYLEHIPEKIYPPSLRPHRER